MAQMGFGRPSSVEPGALDLGPVSAAAAGLRLCRPGAEEELARDIAASLSSPGEVLSVEEYLALTSAETNEMFTDVTVVPLSDLRDWRADPSCGVISHHRGGFFTVEGIEVARSGGQHDRRWQQPVIVQGEIGVLGILAKRFAGVLHFLMQNKAEPGNPNGIQLSPTVQATRSNFTRVHGGSATPYLEYFLGTRSTAHRRVLVDARQSEHGAWFLRKRNRNVVVEVFDDVELRPHYHWLTLGQIAQLMRRDNWVNMDARSVLACLPFNLPEHVLTCGDEAFRRALVRSFSKSGGSVMSRAELTSWVTRARTDEHVVVESLPLDALTQWSFTRERISHRAGRFFSVLGVQVRAGGREVASWDQPMVSGGSDGVVAFVVRRVEGTLHVLMQMRSEGGNLDGPEIGPSVQWTPADYEGEPRTPPSPLLPRVLEAAGDQVHFDQMLSDEGGRFLDTTQRHLVVELDDVDAPPGYRWLTAAQLSDFLQHDNYLNIQARSLMACLQSLLAAPCAGRVRSEGDGRDR